MQQALEIANAEREALSQVTNDLMNSNIRLRASLVMLSNRVTQLEAVIIAGGLALPVGMTAAPQITAPIAPVIDPNTSASESDDASTVSV